MKTKIPQFLIEMSKQLNEQDNRITADPLFEVRYKKSIVTEEDYNQSHWEIISDEGDTLYHSELSEDYTELAEHVFDYHNEWCRKWCIETDNENLIDEGDVVEDDFIDVFSSDYDSNGWLELPAELKKLYMQEIEVTVNSHFTEADANAFIKRKQHDYPPLYTYVISMYFCENMKQLRNWIKDLTSV